MRKLRGLWKRLAGRLRGSKADQDFSAEIESNVELDVVDGVHSGLSHDEARRRALIRLGGAEQARQAHRDGRTLLWLENLLQDLRYGLRTLRRSPGFTATAALTLGLGIGACTAVFSLVNAVLIRSLPYGDPQRLVYLFTPNPHLKIPAEVVCPSYGDFYDIKRDSRSYEDMTSYEQALFSMATQGGTQRIGGARVDEGFFSTLQSAPELGRAIGAEDNQPNRAHVAVISHSLWVSMFGGSADVLNRTLQLDGTNYQVVGVMPPEFEYPFNTDLPYGEAHIKSTRIWVPLALDAKKRADRDPNANVSVARLRPGVTIRQAQGELSTMMARLDKQYPGEMREWGALVESFTALSIGPVRPLMRLLLATVGLVLLIACGNAANLLLARAAERARELGVRAALGAGRGRMIRQLLTESLLICAGGGGVGVGLAFLFLRILPRLDPGNIPRLNESSLDGRVLLAAIAFSVLTGLLTGLLPAWSAARTDVTEFLKSHAVRGYAAAGNRTQNILIVAQTAMVVVLLASAGLLIRSYINVVSVDTGFSRSTVTFRVDLDSRYRPGPPQRDFFKNFITRLGALPGVQAVGAVNHLPLSNTESLDFFWVDGFPNVKDQMSEGRSVSPGYFAAMNIPLIAGRTFSDADEAPDARTAIINERFAKTYFAGRNPIGGRISTDEKQSQWSTVVGVVADVRHTSLEEDPGPQLYRANEGFDGASIAVRSTLEPAAITAEIRSTLRSIDPSLAITDVGTMGNFVSQASARRRFQTSLLTAFAAIALLLALVGLYGLMAYSVSRRTREVGIRMALGAQRSHVLLLVLKNAAALVGCGVGAGLVAAWLTTRMMRSFLFGVSVHDPTTIAAVCALLLLCGLMAALLPARRAASADPMKALRTE
ncbi:MAG TPA: ABC transporter permease [Terracidiphilus sp.]